ncbi:MAG: YqaE/Pmp3 family membrane protein [Fluviicola sp.]|jgi:uncharacterized membrane protein YqaE (UPF0057 family)
MKIKLNSKSLLVMISMIGFLYSCSTSNSVVSNRLVSKRKYTDGFHYNGKVNTKSSDNVAITEEKKATKSVLLTEDAKSLNSVDEVSKIEKNESVVLIENVVSTVATETTQVSTKSERSSSKKSMVVSTNEKQNTIQKTVKQDVKANKNSKAEIRKALKENRAGDDAILYIILCILLPFVAVGLATDWDLTKTLICLLLSILFWIPGVIYAFIICSQEGVL